MQIYRGDTVAAGVACPAKINLGLRVCGRRDDGYHLIESEMVAISVFDRLSLRISPGPLQVDLENSGRGGVPPGRNNLVVRAAELFMQRTGCSARLGLRLEKRIPVGAGLGGGSSDAAAVLRVLDELLGCQVGTMRLRDWALELGADVPFFVLGEPALVSGIGEMTRPLGSWPEVPLVVAFRGSGLATAAVYARFDAALTSPDAASNIAAFPSLHPSPRRNDLEGAACELDPGIKELKKELISQGASDVGMSGSGSAVFGFFADEAAARCSAEMLTSGGDWAEAAQILAGPAPIERLDPEQDW